MGNIMIQTAIAIGEKHTFFISEHYNFIGNIKLEEGTLLNSNHDSVDQYDHHVLKCFENAFTKMRIEEIRSFFKYAGEEMGLEDEDED